LLRRANEAGPFVLAGHSFGGLYALAFAANYPDDVAGLVLVDSTAPAPQPEPELEQHTRPEPDDTANRASALAAGVARLGVGRLVGLETPSHLRSAIDEYIQAGSSAQQAAALTDFNDKPLIVLTAGIGSRPGWAASQEALAVLSTNSLHRVIDGSTHASLIDEQDDAAATTQGILDVVSAVRTGRLLVP
jgi:pimeloyl-ACP methyl ester carboxylesterase